MSAVKKKKINLLRSFKLEYLQQFVINYTFLFVRFLILLKLNFKGKKLSEEELNSLIAHAHRRIEQLQHQLANHLALEKERIQEALDMQRKADESVCDRRIEDEAQKIKNSVDLEKQKWVSKADVN